MSFLKCRAKCHCVKVIVRIAGIDSQVEAFIIDSLTSYSLLLGRQWMREVMAIGHYQHESYYVQEHEMNLHKLHATHPTTQMPSPMVYIHKGSDDIGQRFNEDMTQDIYDHELQESEKPMQELAGGYEEEYDEEGLDDSTLNDNAPTVGTSGNGRRL